MPDLSDALADKVANEQEELVDTETTDGGGESTDTFDAGAISDALQEIYPDIDVEDEEPAEITLGLPRKNRLTWMSRSVCVQRCMQKIQELKVV